MLYHLLYPLHTQVSVLNVTQYITFRTAAASLTAFVISVVLGPWMIRKLREFPDQSGDSARRTGGASAQGGHADDGRPAHSDRSAHPDDALGRFDQSVRLDRPWGRRWPSVPLGSSMTISRSCDARPAACNRDTSWSWQAGVATLVGLSLLALADENLYTTRLIFPFFKNLIPDLGWWYVPFAVLVLVGAANAVNLTDGLDGLAI